MAAIYELIGRLVVRFAWWRYGRQITIAGAVFGGVVAGARLRPRQAPAAGGLAARSLEVADHPVHLGRR